MTDDLEEALDREAAPCVRVVLLTAPAVAVAQSLARALLEERLVACVNVVPGITSIYRWKGRVEESSEVLLIAKTASDRIEALGRAVQRLHPYDTPELVVLDTDVVAPRYEAWVLDETR